MFGRRKRRQEAEPRRISPEEILDDKAYATAFIAKARKQGVYEPLPPTEEEFQTARALILRAGDRTRV